MSARRSAVNSVRKLRRSSFCTGVYAFFSRMVSRALRLLFFLAGDTGPGPRNRREPRLGDRLAAVAADAVRALFHAPQRAFDRLQDLGVGLFQFQLNVHLVVAGGLIGDVALAAGIVLHRPLQRFGGTAPEQLAALAHQRYPKYFQIHAGVLLRGPSRQGQAEIVPRPSTGPRGRVRSRRRYSARSVASGLRRRTSRLATTPTAATTSAVATMPPTVRSGAASHSRSSA